MKSSDFKIERPLNGLSEKCKQLQPHGMDLYPIDEYGHPVNLRCVLNIPENAFVICAFMASRLPIGLPGIADLVENYASSLAKINKDHDLDICLLNGGGNPLKDPCQEPGLMAKWNKGIIKGGAPIRIVIMQDLIEKEGVPPKEGNTVILKQHYGEVRIGQRGDGLINAADAFIIFPGGLGTEAEAFTFLTDATINNESRWKKAIFVDPLCKSQKTGKSRRFWANDIAVIEQRYEHNLISSQALEVMNNSCILYRPEENFDLNEACRDLISATLAIRDKACVYAPHAAYTPLPAELRKKYIIPISNRESKIAKLFDDFEADHSWMQIPQSHITNDSKKQSTPLP